MLRDAEKTVGGMADKAKTVVLSYLDAEGYPTSRAMLAPREREGIRTFWFSTSTSSNKVSRFRADPRAGLYLMNPRFFRGVSLTGTVEAVETPSVKERLWLHGDAMYYPLGVAAPDYRVLKFPDLRGRYYSNFHSEDFEIPRS